MRGLLLAILALFGVTAQEGIPEPPDSKVHVVTYDNFDRFIKKNPLVLMEFYAPWCGHCQNLAPVYREAAKQMSEADLPTPVTFAKFNDGNEYNRQLRGGAEDMFNYTGYPALLLFKKKKLPVANPEHWKRKYMKRQWQFYGGGRETPEDFIMYLSAVSKGLDPFAEERKAMPGFYKKGGKHETDLIVDLEPDGEAGFNTTILEDPRNVLWIVEFYSDRCPFCNSLAPEITRAAGEMKKEFNGKILYAAVNSRVYDEIATQHEVTSWPWVAAFYQGQKVEDMAGLGGWESVVRFSKDMHSKVWRKEPPANAFLAKKAGVQAAILEEKDVVSDAEGVAAAPDAEANAELEALLATAVKYNIKSKSAADKLRAKAASSMESVLTDLKAKLAPVAELEAKLAAALNKEEL